MSCGCATSSREYSHGESASLPFLIATCKNLAARCHVQHRSEDSNRWEMASLHYLRFDTHATVTRDQSVRCRLPVTTTFRTRKFSKPSASIAARTRSSNTCNVTGRDSGCSREAERSRSVHSEVARAWSNILISRSIIDDTEPR